MDLYVFMAVLVAAAFHAGWNALLKLKIEPLAATVLVAVSSGLVVLPFFPLVEMPARASWPYILASIIIHIAYFIALAEAYRLGDLTQMYPIARGTAPLMTAILATAWLGEALGIFGWGGVIFLAAGILLLAFKGGRALQKFDGRAIGFALATSLTITAYTLVDGIGARLSGSSGGYSIWLFIGDAVTMTVYGLLRIGTRIFDDFKSHWRIAVAGAALSVAAYAIAIWAMTVAPIALVAALRETSVLFAAVFGTLLLREPLLPVRIAAAVLVLFGAVLLRFR